MKGMLATLRCMRVTWRVRLKPLPKFFERCRSGEGRRARTEALCRADKVHRMKIARPSWRAWKKLVAGSMRRKCCSRDSSTRWPACAALGYVREIYA